MPPLQVVLLGLPSALQLVALLFVPAFVLVVRRKWRLAAVRREEVRRLVLLASEEAARAEIEAAYEYRSRLEYDHSQPSAAVAPGPTVNPACAVCYSPTSTRCSRCKAVKYCSRKCQIIHWRQGHKEECHPPKIDTQPNTQESSSELRTQQIESSNLWDGESVTLDAISNQTTHQERPISSSSSFLSTNLSEEGNLKTKHIADTSATKCSSSSVKLSPPSIHSTSTVPSEDGAFVHDASTQDNPARHEESCGTSNVSHTATSEMSKRKLNKSSHFECIGADPSVGDISSLNNLNERTSDCCTEEVGCRSGSSFGPSLNGMNNCTVSKLTEDHADYLEPTSVFVGDGGSGCTDSTSSRAAAVEVGHHQHHRPAIQFSTNTKFSCHVVPSHTTIPKQVQRDIPSRIIVSEASDPSTGGFDVSASDLIRINTIELPPKPRETGSVPIVASVDKKSSSSNGHSVSRTMSLKVVNASSVHTRMSGMTSSISNGSYDLKTSVQKVVQQFKPSKVSKNYRQMLFPYDIFVKLYNEKVEMRPSGLINCGNSCYANVVLQCLAFTRPLTSYLLQGLHTKSCPKKEWCFTCEFESLVFKGKQGQSPLSPINIISQIQSIGSHLGHGREEDAHEFLRYAIDAMQSVCLKEDGPDSTAPFSEETTLIQLTFGGYLRSKIKCMRCQSKSERNERMMDLTVEIHGDVATLEEALARFTMTEILDGENKYQCSRCKSYEKAKKRLKVLEAPNILTIVLKRFQSGKFGKLNKAVRFPEFLNLAKYMSGTSDKSPIYRLYAVVVHLDVMNAAFSGHYVCYVMNATGKWYKIDDNTVKPVELDRVLSKSAYMLFYARCSPRAPSLIRHTMSHDKGKFKSKCRDAISSVTHPRPQNYPNWTNSNPARMGMWDSSDTSDSSSLLSCSDEGSCSTESTRDSTSTDGFSEYIFGESGHWNSPMRFSEDSDGFTYSPLFSRHSSEAILTGHLPDSPESGYSASDFSSSGLEEGFRTRGLSYRDYVGEDTTGAVGMTTHTWDGGEVSMGREDGLAFARSGSRSLRKLTEQSSVISRRDTNLANPFNHKSVLSVSSDRDRTTRTLH